MSFPWASNRLLQHLRERWAETEVVAEGEPYDEPNPPRPFVMIAIEAGDIETLGMAGDGKLYDRQHVTIIADAFAPLREGRARPLELAGALGDVLGRLTLHDDPTTGMPGLTTRTPNVRGPWPAEGSAGYLTARCEIPAHVDFWSERNEEG